jgi:alanine racemase
MVHPGHAIHYWRDKSQREIDFVIDRGGTVVDAVEAKVNPDAFDVGPLRVFREVYPKGANYVVCPFVGEAYTIRKAGLSIRICGTHDLGTGD